MTVRFYFPVPVNPFSASRSRVVLSTAKSKWYHIGKLLFIPLMAEGVGVHSVGTLQGCCRTDLQDFHGSESPSLQKIQVIGKFQNGPTGTIAGAPGGRTAVVTAVVELSFANWCTQQSPTNRRGQGHKQATPVPPQEHWQHNTVIKIISKTSICNSNRRSNNPTTLRKYDTNQ